MCCRVYLFFCTLNLFVCVFLLKTFILKDVLTAVEVESLLSGITKRICFIGFYLFTSRYHDSNHSDVFTLVCVGYF